MSAPFLSKALQSVQQCNHKKWHIEDERINSVSPVDICEGRTVHNGAVSQKKRAFNPLGTYNQVGTQNGPLSDKHRGNFEAKIHWKSLCWIILMTLSIVLFNPSINMCAFISPKLSVACVSAATEELAAKRATTSCLWIIYLFVMWFETLNWMMAHGKFPLFFFTFSLK